MPDGTSPPSAAVRRGPPPVPRAPAEAPTTQGSNGAGDSPLEELLALVTAEAEATEAKKRGADLKARAALLHWAAHGDSAKALSLIERIEHPLAPALRLAAALETNDEKLLNQCIADVKKRGDKAELADMGALLV